MPLLTEEGLLKALAAGKRGGVYFLFGDEEYLRDAAAARVIEAHLDPATRDFNLDQLTGDAASPETLGSVLNTPPLMAEWRVVVVRDAQGLAGSARTRELVEQVLERPVPGLALILVARIPSGSRAQFYERLKRKATAVEFAPLAAGDVPGWLLARAAADGVKLDAEAAQALAAAIGAELGVLVRELAKLREYVGERGRITASDVEAVVGRVPRQNRWAWFDMVGEGKLAEARRALPVLLDAGESGVGLVLGLGNQLLRLALVAAGGQRALEAELPPHQTWLARRLAQQARVWTLDALDAALADLARADRLLKSAPLSDLQVMEELLLRIEARRSVNHA
mgnify:CR=1 FL=1